MISLKWLFFLFLTAMSMFTVPAPLRANGWVTKGSLPVPLADFGVAVLNGKIYAIGGVSARFGTVLSTVYVYDSISGSWTTAAPMSTPRHAPAAAVLNGKIYAIGGASTYQGVGGTHLNSVEVYDPSTNRWSSSAPLPSARFRLCAVVNGKIYAIGGSDGVGLRNVEIYDPVTDSWSAGAPMLSSRENFAAAGVNGKIYAIGGRIQDVGGIQGNDVLVSTTDVYDPATDSWSTAAPIPTLRYNLDVAVVNGQIYAVGGFDLIISKNTVEVYDPATNSWAVGPAMPTARNALKVAVLDNQIFAIGGIFPGTDAAYVNTVEALTVETDKLLTFLGLSRLWFGAKNGSEKVRFDVQTEVYKNETLVSSGLTRCISGVSKDPANASEALVAFDPISPVAYSPGDIFQIRVSTRIGTTALGSLCDGDNNIVELFLYYDSMGRPSRFTAQLAPDPVNEFFLHTVGSSDLFDAIAPTGAVSKSKDLGKVKSNKDNPWREIGRWSMTIP